MPRNWAPKTRELIFQLLVDRDGPNCRLCNTDPTEPLEIDHIDQDRTNTASSNLRLLCKACNLAHRRPPSSSGDRGINERERQLVLGEKLSATEKARGDLPYAEGSPEMRANGYFEMRYRAWLLQSTPILKQEAINAGAEEVGCRVGVGSNWLCWFCPGRCGLFQVVR